MADGTIRIELCAPDCAPITLSAAEVLLPGSDGVFAVFPGHTPLLSTLTPGVLQAYDADGGEHFYAVTGGFAEVMRDRVAVLADAFEEGTEIDAERAQSAQERAESHLDKPKESTDVLRAEMALARALARQRAALRQPH